MKTRKGVRFKEKANHQTTHQPHTSYTYMHTLLQLRRSYEHPSASRCSRTPQNEAEAKPERWYQGKAYSKKSRHRPDHSGRPAPHLRCYAPVPPNKRKQPVPPPTEPTDFVGSKGGYGYGYLAINAFHSTTSIVRQAVSSSPGKHMNLGSKNHGHPSPFTANLTPPPAILQT